MTTEKTNEETGGQRPQKLINLDPEETKKLTIEERLENLEVGMLSIMKQLQTDEILLITMAAGEGYAQINADGTIKLFKETQKKTRSNIISL